MFFLGEKQLKEEAKDTKGIFEIMRHYQTDNAMVITEKRRKDNK